MKDLQPEFVKQTLIQHQAHYIEAYYRGIIEGTTRFAWWKDGVCYVGSCGTTLKDAIKRIENEMAARLESLYAVRKGD